MYFDTLQNAYQNNPILIREDAILNQYLQQLIDYYHNGQWLKDYELDEQGKIPRNLKRGILSQDALYNFFDDIKELERWIENCMRDGMAKAQEIATEKMKPLMGSLGNFGM